MRCQSYSLNRWTFRFWHKKSMMRNCPQNLKSNNGSVCNNAKYTKHQMCMHRHGHVSCELLMFIFEINVLESVREWEWCCIIWLASTLFLSLSLSLRVYYVYFYASCFLFSLSIQRVIGYQTIYWTFNRTNPASDFILSSRLSHVNYSPSS